MRITCPSCQSEYDVPEAKARGKNLRCAHCNHRWMPLPPAPPVVVAPEPPELPEREPPPPPPLAEPEPPPEAFARPVLSPRRHGAELVLAGWVVTLLLIGAGGLGFIHDRVHIMRVWPPSIRLYHALALDGAMADRVMVPAAKP